MAFYDELLKCHAATLPAMDQLVQARVNRYAWLPIVVTLFSLFPETQGNYGVPYLLYDYRHGFVKRGLLGVPFMPIHHLTRIGFVTIELAMLAVALFAIYRALSRAIFANKQIAQITAILLCAPTMLPHLAQMFLPTDTVLFALLGASLLCLIRLNPLPAMAVSLLLCLVALFVHEAYLLAMYPALLCVFLHLWRRKSLPLGMIATHIAVMFITFLLINHFGALKGDPAKVYAEAQARVAFPLDVQLFRLMHQTMAQYRRESMDFIFNRPFMQAFALAFVFAAPYFWFVGRLLRRCMKASGYSRTQMLLVTLLCCSPLMLMPLATDWPRWVSNCCICASLFCLFMYCVDTDGGPVETAMLQFANDVDLFAWFGYTVALGSFGGLYLTSADRLIYGYYHVVPPGSSTLGKGF